MADAPLKESFLRAAGARAGCFDGLEAELAAIAAQAEERWPGVTLAREAFAAHLGERVAPDQHPRELHCDDLYLALGCALGVRAALEACDAQLLSQLPRWVSRVRMSAADLQELEQRVRIQLFVGADGTPKITGYSGRGELVGWLRVFAVREAFKLTRHDARAASAADDDDALAEQAADGADPEAAFFDERSRALFRAAFRDAVATLDELDRVLVRQHHLDGLSVDELAALHAQHRSSVFRRLEKARAKVFKATRRLLVERGVGTDECESILRHAQSRLDMTFSSAFEA